MRQIKLQFATPRSMEREEIYILTIVERVLAGHINSISFVDMAKFLELIELKRQNGIKIPTVHQQINDMLYQRINKPQKEIQEFQYVTKTVCSSPQTNSHKQYILDPKFDGKQPNDSIIIDEMLELNEEEMDRWLEEVEYNSQFLTDQEKQIKMATNSERKSKKEVVISYEDKLAQHKFKQNAQQKQEPRYNDINLKMVYSKQTTEEETPRVTIQQRSPMTKREMTIASNKAPPVFRSISFIQQSQPLLNPEREQRMKLLKQIKLLRRKLTQIYSPIMDFDINYSMCMHYILKKKFQKQPDKYFLQSGGDFQLWRQLKNYNYNIKISLMNYAFQNKRIILSEKINYEQMQEIHQLYNIQKESPRKQLPNISQRYLSSLGTTHHKGSKQILPQIQRITLKSSIYYDPSPDQKSVKQRSTSQEQIKEFLAKRRLQSNRELN